MDEHQKWLEDKEKEYLKYGTWYRPFWLKRYVIALLLTFFAYRYLHEEFSANWFTIAISFIVIFASILGIIVSVEAWFKGEV
jgi:hypothetical protein